MIVQNAHPGMIADTQGHFTHGDYVQDGWGRHNMYAELRNHAGIVSYINIDYLGSDSHRSHYSWSWLSSNLQNTKHKELSNQE